MVLPAFAVAFLRDALQARESLLCIGRKNAKSAGIAVYLLGRLAGPLRSDGYRCGVCSVSRAKASELWMQCQQIADASGLDGLLFRKVPRAITSSSGRIDILSADKPAGHASGFDDAIIDELGLIPERGRELVAGLRSSVSARDGRFMALSIQGDSPFTTEMLQRKGSPGTAIHHYTAPADCRIDDESAWHAANPGIAIGIKSLAYMRHEARRVLDVPSDQSTFRAFELNQRQDPSREMLCSVTDWQSCVVREDRLPEREGPAVVGFDMGGSASMTAAAALWIRTGRMEFWGAFPDTPGLADRGLSDGVGNLYERMHDRGEVAIYSGRVTPVDGFLRDVAGRLDGEDIIAAGADRYRKAEALQAMESADVRWPMQWRGTGASPKADGSHDVRAFQRLVLTRTLRTSSSLMMASAISESSIRRDAAGNPALSKARDKARIDCLQASVIAAGLGELHADSGDWDSFTVDIA